MCVQTNPEVLLYTANQTEVRRSCTIVKCSHCSDRMEQMMGLILIRLVEYIQNPQKLDIRSINNLNEINLQKINNIEKKCIKLLDIYKKYHRLCSSNMSHVLNKTILIPSLDELQNGVVRQRVVECNESSNFLLLVLCILVDDATWYASNGCF